VVPGSDSDSYLPEPRFWMASGLPTTRKLATPVNTSAFVGTNPTDERVTSGLPAILTQWGALRGVCGRH
jgi:hypothetical protein